MKILRIIHSADPRGGGVIGAVLSMAQEAIRQGHTVEVLCGDLPSVAWLPHPQVPIHAIGPVGKGYGYSPRWKSWLTENGRGFDAVIVDGLWLYPSWAAWQVLRGSGVPYWVFPHGMLDPWFQDRSKRPFKAIRNQVYWKLIEHRVVRDARGIVFTAAEERRLGRETFRPYAGNETVVPLGIEAPPVLQPAMQEAFLSQCPAVAGRPYVLFLGRIHPKKGIDLLIQSYRECREESGARPIPDLVIAGPGLETEYARQLNLCPPADSQGRSRNSGPPGVHCPGMVEGEAKWGALHGCEAFILPSHQENFGIAVVEALACHKPVLLSDRVNIWREIESDGAALVEPDTLAGTRKLLQRWLATDAAQRAAMGDAASRSFATRFTIEQSTRALLQTIGADY